MYQLYIDVGGYTEMQTPKIFKWLRITNRQTLAFNSTFDMIEKTRETNRTKSETPRSRHIQP